MLFKNREVPLVDGEPDVIQVSQLSSHIEVGGPPLKIPTAASRVEAVYISQSCFATLWKRAG